MEQSKFVLLQIQNYWNISETLLWTLTSVYWPGDRSVCHNILKVTLTVIISFSFVSWHTAYSKENHSFNCFTYTCCMMNNIIQLFSISQKGYVEVATLLAEKNADINLQNKYGMSAIMFASQVSIALMKTNVIIIHY